MRFRQRHVHQTIYRYLQAELTTLGWMNQPVNFGATAVTLLAYEPQQAGVTPAPNTVAVSIETVGEDEPFELGGLHSCAYTCFVDVYGENESTGVSIAEDIKDLLSHHEMPVRNYSADVDGVSTDLWMEFEHVLIEAIPTTGALDKRTWRSVKATAVVYF